MEKLIVMTTPMNSIVQQKSLAKRMKCLVEMENVFKKVGSVITKKIVPTEVMSKNVM